MSEANLSKLNLRPGAPSPGDHQKAYEDQHQRLQSQVHPGRQAQERDRHRFRPHIMGGALLTVKVGQTEITLDEKNILK